MTKNYIGFVNDHSGSMGSLSKAAIADSNANIAAVKNSATREVLDTIVYCNDFNSSVTRSIVNSNPHVLREVTTWNSSGMTALFDAIGDMIAQLKAVPDYIDKNVSFLVMATTDGEENYSRNWNAKTLAHEINALQNTGRWTFVLRVPRGASSRVSCLGIPAGNIQEWETTSAGMAVSTAATTVAMESYYSARASGATSSGSFYASAANVSAKQVKTVLTDISAEVSSWTVLAVEDGVEIKPFCDKRLGGMPFLKGAAFYQLNKVEARVQDTKRIVIRDKKTGHCYEGAAARDMIGLPHTGTVRVHPGNYSNYDIFIQSTSINRKLVAGSQVLYWPKVGVGFQMSDFPWLQNGQAVQDPSLLTKAAQAVADSTTSVTPKSGPKKTPAGIKVYFDNRDAARASGKTVHDAGSSAPKGKRWFVYK